MTQTFRRTSGRYAVCGSCFAVVVEVVAAVVTKQQAVRLRHRTATSLYFFASNIFCHTHSAFPAAFSSFFEEKKAAVP